MIHWKATAPPEAPPTVTTAGTWSVHEHDRVASTNLLAASLPPWHAVTAKIQTAGRGRFQREWISDEGGLWLSAVVPIQPKSSAARLLPLAAGLAVCEALTRLGVTGLRLRWPNDILADTGKLAGLLIDQITPGLAVIGIGVNVANRPESHDPGLRGQVSRLADLLSPVPPLRAITLAVLSELEAVWKDLHTRGPEDIARRVNGLWRAPLPVQLDLDGTIVSGQFEGVDAAGRLQLRTGDGGEKLFEPHEVRLLRDIPNIP